MNLWKEMKYQGIAKIEKCIAEFNVWEFNKSPYGKFKVKIFEDLNGNFTGYTNLLIVDELGDFYCSVGHGKSVEIALEDTINEFFKMLSWKEHWNEQDFKCADSFDF